MDRPRSPRSREELLFYRAESVRRLTAEETVDTVRGMRELKVVDAKSEQPLTLEDLKVTQLQQRSVEVGEAGWCVVLIGLGSPKTALKYTQHLGFEGRITVDPSLATYRAMGWDNHGSLATAKTSMVAAERLKACATCPDPEMFLIGGGITSASQNGGYVAVTRDGAQIPFFYRQSEAGDLPDLDEMLRMLRG